MLLGLPLAKVIELTTIAPAKAIGRSETLGSLRPGRMADISVFELAHGDFPVTDSKNDTRIAHSRLVPVFSLRQGGVYASPSPLDS